MVRRKIGEFLREPVDLVPYPHGMVFYVRAGPSQVFQPMHSVYLISQRAQFIGVQSRTVDVKLTRSFGLIVGIKTVRSENDDPLTRKTLDLLKEGVAVAFVQMFKDVQSRYAVEGVGAQW